LENERSEGFGKVDRPAGVASQHDEPDVRRRKRKVAAGGVVGATAALLTGMESSVDMLEANPLPQLQGLRLGLVVLIETVRVARDGP
jgi:hypothetical protein